MHYQTKDLGGFHAVRIIAADIEGDWFNSSPFHLGDGISTHERVWLDRRLKQLLASHHLKVNRDSSQGAMCALFFIDSFGERHVLLPGDRIVFTEDKHLYFKQACFEYLFEQVA